MSHRYLKADDRLTEYIRTVLVIENGSDGVDSELPLFTRGMPALVCRRSAGENSISLYGQTVPDEVWQSEDNTTLIAFFFKPFRLAPVFKLAASELKNAPVDIAMWNAQKMIALNLQLIHADSTESKIEVLTHFINMQIVANQRDCDIVKQATDKLMQDSNAETLSQLISELNLTERTFQRIFKKYTGIPPNEYRRICQFYFAFTQLKSGHFNKLTDVAFANGYFDQSHYIRAFKEFTTTTPNEYLRSGLNVKKE